ncbi:MAG: hypothetical protein ACT4OK_09010 [Gemmobacter sp.]
MRFLDPWFDPQVQAAVLAGFFLAAGWVVNGREQRKVAAQLREERVRDVLRALYSEIRAYVALLRHDGVGVQGAVQAARIRSEAGYFPFVPTERNATIFSSILNDISILPDSTIHPIVLYYTQIDTIEALIGDLRALDLTRMGPERAAEIYTDFTQAKIEAAELGADALDFIAAYLAYAPAPEAADIAGWAAAELAALNTPQDSGRSGP